MKSFKKLPEKWHIPVMVLAVFLTLLLIFSLSGCDVTADADDLQKARIESQVAQAEKSVSPPRVTKFTQLRDAVRIIELADSNISTWSYYMDMHGKLHFLCESKGYGLPYSTQTTNPQKKEWGNSGGSIALPQAEPSGLYMPDDVAATWVLCINNDGAFDAVYWEPDLIVSPFELTAASSLRQ